MIAITYVGNAVSQSDIKLGAISSKFHIMEGIFMSKNASTALSETQHNRAKLWQIVLFTLNN